MTTAPVPPPTARSAWTWIPSLYFAQGIPYVVVMTLSTVLYKNLRISNTDIALYTSWLYLPWVIKPLWSPLVDMFGRKRTWIVTLQFAIGLAFALVALTLPGPRFFQLSLAVFWLMAFSSATHDIAADGFYLLALKPGQQAAFVGVRSTFYRLATLTAQGGLVYLAGRWQDATGSVVQAWTYVFGLLAAIFLAAGTYHLLALPRPESDRPTASGQNLAREFFDVFAVFLRKPDILTILSFLLLYRLAESQALKLLSPFLLDSRAAGGLGLTTQQVGIVYGTVGIIALTIGGLLGGWVISLHGLKRWLWPMILATHVPIVAFLLLAIYQPTSLWVVGLALATEQFGYGFGFTAYMLYMMLVADGPHKTAHYAICTGFMALGMMLPGMGAGWIQDQVGYVKFFLWVLVCTVPSFIVITRLKIDPAFGRKSPR
ncbi:MAG: AmpG family muropeptide MFS transporter [Verrucomicrobia bacterium]|nr:AmpG family muropeptide MFS transporter [Verrucomicrobiota bacterium]